MCMGGSFTASWKASSENQKGTFEEVEFVLSRIASEFVHFHRDPGASFVGLSEL